MCEYCISTRPRTPEAEAASRAGEERLLRLIRDDLARRGIVPERILDPHCYGTRSTKLRRSALRWLRALATVLVLGWYSAQMHWYDFCLKLRRA